MELVPNFDATDGQQWSLRIDVAAVRRVRRLLGVDLIEIATDLEKLGAMISDPVMVCDVACAVLRPDLEARGVDDEQFAQSIFGDAILSVRNALLAALTDFFPRDQRTVLAALVRKATQFEVRTMAKMTQAMPQIDAAMDRAIETLESQVQTALAELGDTSGAAPASSASIPTRSP